MSENRKTNFIRQGTILAMASIIVRMIGIVYRIPVANIIGDEGNGIYGAAYEIYNLALILSSYSLPLAVSKLLLSTACKGLLQDRKENLYRSAHLLMYIRRAYGTAYFLRSRFYRNIFL